VEKVCTTEMKLKQNSFETVCFSQNSREAFPPITTGTRCLCKTATYDAVNQNFSQQTWRSYALLVSVKSNYSSYWRNYFKQDGTRYSPSYFKKQRHARRTRRRPPPPASGLARKQRRPIGLPTVIF